MPSNRVSLRLPLTLALTAACGGEPTSVPNSTPLDIQPLLVTDQSSYTAVPTGPDGPYRQFSFDVEVRLTNASEHPLYLARCLPADDGPVFHVLPADDQTAEAAYSPVWACPGHDRPIPVAPGATRRDRLRITGPNAWRSGGIEHSGALSGRFRLFYVASTCRNEGDCPVGSVEAGSNEFEVSLSTERRATP
jgi:hypothetical protein